ncbi:MAG TPA: hypothetical protein VFL98_03180 [Candidatus Paceibacterota bacterium]|nr:hypothetical protein [Candidatus Paceibacterota bacterium]
MLRDAWDWFTLRHYDPAHAREKQQRKEERHQAALRTKAERECHARPNDRRRRYERTCTGDRAARAGTPDDPCPDDDFVAFDLCAIGEIELWTAAEDRLIARLDADA